MNNGIDDNGEKNKVAFVTGSTKGIGLAILKDLAAKGYRVIGNSRKDRKLLLDGFVELIESTDNIDYVAGDVCDEHQAKEVVEKIISKYKRIDILINNVGKVERKPLIYLKGENFKDILKHNIDSSFNCTKYVVRYMIQQKYGRIVNISSIAGIHGLPFESSYSTAKAALVGFSKSIAKEYGNKGITCNVVAPGVMNKEDVIHNEKNRKAVLDLIPLGREGEVEEVAALVSFLASKESGYITGQVIQVDGGLCL